MKTATKNKECKFDNHNFIQLGQHSEDKTAKPTIYCSKCGTTRKL